MIKVGTLISCSHHNDPDTYLGVIITMEGKINGGTGNNWAEIYWLDGRRTWEEWDECLGLCFEVIA